MKIKFKNKRRTHLLEFVLIGVLAILILSSLSISTNASFNTNAGRISPSAVPTGYDDSYSTLTDTVLNVIAPGVLANDVDGDGDRLLTIFDTTTTNGELILKDDGSFSYSPDKGFTGRDKFTYIVSDGKEKGNIVNVVIDVNPPNTAPVGYLDKYKTEEDKDLNVNAPGVLKNDTDKDGDTLSAILDVTTSFGELTLKSDGSFRYTPEKSFIGVDKFTYIVFDGKEKGNSVIVEINVQKLISNTAPVANNDRFSITQDVILGIIAPGVLKNDTDFDGDTLSAILDTTTSYGELILKSDGSFSYTPDKGFIGLDKFTYIISDGTNKGNTATVEIDVRRVTNTAPSSFADNYSVEQDSVLRVREKGVLENDTDSDGDGLTAVLESTVSYGLLTLEANGSFVYTPNTGYSGLDKFSYKAYDGKDYSIPVPVVITIVDIDNTITDTVTSSDKTKTDEPTPTKSTTEEPTRTSSTSEPISSDKTSTSTGEEPTASPDLPVSASGPTIFMLITFSFFAALNIIRRRNY